MNTIALLTGRGNNTLKDKNVLDILGKPVLYYPAKAARNSDLVNDWYCSSDDDKILYEAKLIGYKPIRRPAKLALPSSQHIDCILHFLDELKAHGNTPDILVVLLANNVTVKSQWISDCVQLMQNDMSISSVVPVYVDNDHHPLRAKKLGEDGTLEMYEQNINTPVSTNRQDLPPCYFLAHNFWVLNVSMMLNGSDGQKPWTFMGNRIMPYKIDKSIDIHEYSDLLVAKEWVVKNYVD